MKHVHTYAIIIAQLHPGPAKHFHALGTALGTLNLERRRVGDNRIAI